MSGDKPAPFPITGKGAFCRDLVVRRGAGGRALLAEPAQPGVDFVEGLPEVGPQAPSQLGVARALQDGRQASPQPVDANAEGPCC